MDSIAINGVHDESRLRGLESPSLRRKWLDKRGNVYYKRDAKSPRNSQAVGCVGLSRHALYNAFQRTRNGPAGFSCAKSCATRRLIFVLAISRGRTVCFFFRFFSAGKKEGSRVERSSCRFLSLRRRSLVRFPRSSWPTFTRLPSPLCSLHTSRSCNLRLTERKPKGSDRVVTRSVHTGSLNEETRRRNRSRLYRIFLSSSDFISSHFVAAFIPCWSLAMPVFLES